jgi:hypothetical protein
MVGIYLVRVQTSAQQALRQSWPHPGNRYWLERELFEGLGRADDLLQHDGFS